MKNKPIIIIAGDPLSVFIEIFLKSINQRKFKNHIIIICCKKNLEYQIKKLNYKNKINPIDLKQLKSIKLKKNEINLINLNLKTTNSKKLQAKFNSEYIKKSFDIAFKLIRDGYSYKIVNGPINKKVFLKKKYLGITEYIASNFNTKKFGMLIYNENLSVSPLTTHLPIKLVSQNINKSKLQDNILIIDNFFRKYLKKKPKIGVTGLNPHCESILKFNEDEKIISKSIIFLQSRNIDVSGPYPADTIFLKNNRKNFDVILGMYHDQVLGPIKTLFEYDAINITMGLPFMRVTPDHGPNYSMYLKNKSSPLSLIKALEFLDKQW